MLSAVFPLAYSQEPRFYHPPAPDVSPFATVLFSSAVWTMHDISKAGHVLEQDLIGFALTTLDLVLGTCLLFYCFPSIFAS